MMRRFVCLLVVFLQFGCGGASQQTGAYAPPAVQAEYAMAGSAATTAADEGPSFFGPARASDGKSAQYVDNAPTSIDQRLVKNAWMTIQVPDEKHFEPAVARAEEIARRLKGYVANQSRNAITFKVPTPRLDEALAALAELGKVKHRDVSAVDVTASYMDLEIRIENLRKVRDRLQELVQQGQNVQEILEVEKELARVTTELESLEGQMRLLQNQVSFATVNVTFKERVLPGPLGWVFYGGYHVVKWLFVWD